MVEATVSSAGAQRFARLLGCADTEASGPRRWPRARLSPASTSPRPRHRPSWPGRQPPLLQLRADLPPRRARRPDRTRLRAETRAEFPGPQGRRLPGAGDRHPHARPRHPPHPRRRQAPRRARCADSGVATVSATAAATSGSSPTPAARSSRSASARASDPAYPRYPPIPVLSCPGFEPRPDPRLPRRPDSGADQAEAEDQGGDADQGAEDGHEGGEAEDAEPGQEGEHAVARRLDHPAPQRVGGGEVGDGRRAAAARARCRSPAAGRRG